MALFQVVLVGAVEGGLLASARVDVLVVRGVEHSGREVKFVAQPQRRSSPGR